MDEEVSLVERGPGRPGRPMRLGGLVWKRARGQYEITEIREESSIRMHLGHCANCGQEVVAGMNRMTALLKVLQKNGLISGHAKVDRPRLRHRLGKFLLRGVYPH